MPHNTRFLPLSLLPSALDDAVRRFCRGPALMIDSFLDALAVRGFIEYSKLRPGISLSLSLGLSVFLRSPGWCRDGGGTGGRWIVGRAKIRRPPNLAVRSERKTLSL